MEVVAYGPPWNWEPYVPDFLIVKDGPVLLISEQGASPDREVSLHQLLIKNEAVRIQSPTAWKTGYWLVLDRSPTWIPSEKMETWRSRRAREVLADAVGIKGDPETRILRLKTASKLAGVPMERLVDRLESVRESPGETLDQIYKRVKTQK